MKIKIFIVTYKNEQLLYTNLCSILGSDVSQYDSYINVINNYTESFNLQNFCEQNNIKVYHNVLRPDFSTGHLSRSWNQCIINGFKNLNAPDCDILILAQDDNSFASNWLSTLIDYHNKYEFISMGGGDQFHSYTANHIKKVGLWDERFCNIGYQEYDYFTRCYLYNKDKSSINDWKHARVHNPLPNKILDEDDKYVGGCRNDPRHLDSLQYHNISLKILRAKWGEDITRYNKETGWNFAYMDAIRNCNIPNFVYYPYFEKDIDYTNKNYII